MKSLDCGFIIGIFVCLSIHCLECHIWLLATLHHGRQWGSLLLILELTTLSLWDNPQCQTLQMLIKWWFIAAKASFPWTSLITHSNLTQNSFHLPLAKYSSNFLWWCMLRLSNDNETIIYWRLTKCLTLFYMLNIIKITTTVFWVIYYYYSHCINKEFEA